MLEVFVNCPFKKMLQSTPHLPVDPLSEKCESGLLILKAKVNFLHQSTDFAVTFYVLVSWFLTCLHESSSWSVCLLEFDDFCFM